MKTYLVVGHGVKKSGPFEDCLVWAKQKIDSGDGTLFSLARQRAGEELPRSFFRWTAVASVNLDQTHSLS